MQNHSASLPPPLLLCHNCDSVAASTNLQGPPPSIAPRRHAVTPTTIQGPARLKPIASRSNSRSTSRVHPGTPSSLYRWTCCCASANKVAL